MSKAKSLLGLVSPTISARSAVKEFQAAKDERDRLELANAIAHIAVFIVGVLLTIRELRTPDEE